MIGRILRKRGKRFGERRKSPGHSMRCSLSVLCLLALCPPPATAQSVAVSGTVTDLQGLAVPGVTMTITAEDGQVQSATTGPTGTYRFEGLAPARYRVGATLVGFGTLTREAVLDARTPVSIDFVLRPSYTEAVVVSAGRNEQTLLTAPATVTVIQAAEVGIQAANNFADLLRGVAGLNTLQMNARDINLNTRGSTRPFANRQLVMVDGRLVNSQLYGNVFWDMVPIGFDDIGQVEVINTPGSATWGANAMTGVINIRTKPPREAQGGLATVGFGEVGTRSASLRWAQAFDRLSYRVSAGYFRQDAWERDNTLPDGSPFPPTAAFENQGTERARFDVRVDWEPEAGVRWSGSGGFADTNGLFHTVVGPWAFLPAGSYSAYAAADYATDPLEVKVYWNRERADAQSTLFGIFTLATTDTFVGEVTARRSVGNRQALVYGGNVRFTAFDVSIARGDSGRSDSGGWRAAGGVGAFVEDQIVLSPQVTWGIGARVNKFDTFDAIVSPRTTLIIQPNPAHSIRVAYNRAFRAPSLFENHGDVDLPNSLPLVPGQPPFIYITRGVGSLDLNPEIIHAVEVGYSLLVGDRASVSATVYRHSISNNIGLFQTERFSPTDPPPGWPLSPELVPPLSKTFGTVNVGTIRDQGVELALHTDWEYGVSTRASYTFQADTEIIEDDPTLPLPLNQPPRYQWAFGVFRDGPRWRGSLNVAYTDEAFWMDGFDSRFWGTTDSYVLTSGQVAVTLPGSAAEIVVSAINMFDRKIQQHVFGDILRRQLKTELRVRWR